MESGEELHANGHDEQGHEPERLHLAVQLHQHGGGRAERKPKRKTEDEIQPEGKPEDQRQRQAGADEKRMGIRQQRRRTPPVYALGNGG